MHVFAEDVTGATATPSPTGAAEAAAVRQLRLELAHERETRLQAEQRAARAEQRALVAEERCLVAEWLVSVLRSELTGAEPRRRLWWRPWSRQHGSDRGI